MCTRSTILRRRNPVEIGTAGRTRLAARLIGMAAVLQVCVALLASTATPAAADAEIACEPNDVCRIVKTRLPLRVLPRVNSNIYQDKDGGSPVIEANVPAFVPLFVFERSDVSYADPIRPSGWFRVGKNRDKAIGYMKAADALEWKTAVVVSYAHRGVGENERRPVIMFKDSAPLRSLVLDPKLSDRADKYYSRLISKDVPDEVITREPDTYVDIKKKFYLLPVIESMDLSDQGIDDAHILQIAAAVPNARAKAEDMCTTERKDFAECSKKVGAVTDDELKIDWCT
jgi:serine/threonine-protein kinase PpkA